MNETVEFQLRTYFDMRHQLTSTGNVFDYQLIAEDLEAMHAQEVDVSQQEAEKLRLMYDRPPLHRRYHTSEHGNEIGQTFLPPELLVLLKHFSTEEAGAIAGMAGRIHDAVYAHVDSRPDIPELAWRTETREFVGDNLLLTHDVENSNLLHYAKMTEAGQQDAVTRMVADVFGLDHQKRIQARQGGNEFVSALAGSKFMEQKRIPPQFLVAVAAAVEATIPFRETLKLDRTARITDGCMGKLARRIDALDFELNGERFEPNWDMINDICLIATHVANRDITDFVLPNNYHNVIRGGRAIIAEETPELREDAPTVDDLVYAARVERSSPSLYIALASRSNQRLSPDYVPKGYIMRDGRGRSKGVSHTYPPYHIFTAAGEYTEINARMAGFFFQIRELGIVTTACVAKLIGAHNARVPGIVDADHWTVMPQRKVDFSAYEHDLASELISGPADYKESRTAYYSPISGFILRQCGLSGALQLSEQLQEIYSKAIPGERNPFSRAKNARLFLKQLIEVAGIDTFEAIADGLAHVSYVYRDDPERGDPHRESAILELRDQFRHEYEAEQAAKR